MTEKPITIMIVDDNPDFLFTTATFLERSGFRTLTAEDGKTALTVIQKERPDLILLDVMMETMFSGFEVCKAVRKDPALKETPIIGVSAMVDELGVGYNQIPDYEYFSPDEFIDKPVDKPLLLKRIEAVLETAAQRKARPKWEKDLEDAQMRKFLGQT